MCGRFNLLANPRQLAEIFAVLREPVWPVPRYDIRPSQDIVAVRQHSDGTRTADLLQWGLLPAWAKERTAAMTLARADGVATKPSFRGAFKSRRCIIPMSGFYEWQPLAGKDKQKWHVYRPDGEVLAVAGLWETWQDDDGNPLETCCVITTEPNASISAFHDRMPAILSPEEIGPWLDPEVSDPGVLQSLLHPSLEGRLSCDTVANINSETPDCIKPAKPPRRLFD